MFALKLILLVAAFALASTVALDPFDVEATNASNPIQNPIGAGATFSTIICNVVKYANSLLAPLSTLMVLIAGFLYMTGGGNPEKIKTAHKVLIWALVGIAIVLLANAAEAIIRSVVGGTASTSCQ